MKKHVILLSVLALSVCLGAFLYGTGGGNNSPQSDNAAAVDYFLKINGIEGESTDSLHRGNIELDSFHWELNGPASRTAGGAASGKVTFQDLHFTTKTNKSSPLLMLAAAKGDHFNKAELFVRKPGKPQEYMKLTLENVLVSSYSTGGSGDTVPTDEVSLHFDKIEFEYKPQDEKGTPVPSIKSGWDLKAGGGT